MAVGLFLRQKVRDSLTVGTGPHPALAHLGVLRLAVVPKIFVEGGPVFTQGKSEALMKVVVRRDAMGDQLCLALEKVAADISNHVCTPESSNIKTPSSLCPVRSQYAIILTPMSGRV